MQKTVLGIAALVLLGVGFAAGFAVGRQSAPTPPRSSPTDRLAQHLLDEAERNRPIEAKRMEEADALQKAFMKKLDRDLRKISDEDRGKEK